MKWLIEAIEGGLKYWLMVGGRIREKVERRRRRIWYRNIRKTRSVKIISARFYTYEYQYQRVATKIAKFLLRQLAVWCKGTCPFPIDEGHTRTWTKGRRRKRTLAGSGCIACTSASGAPCLRKIPFTTGTLVLQVRSVAHRLRYAAYNGPGKSIVSDEIWKEGEIIVLKSGLSPAIF